MYRPTVGVLSLLGAMLLSLGAGAQTQSMLDVLAIDASGNNPQALFRILDKNGDGKVSGAEFRLRKYAIFVAKDLNEDGIVIPEEVPGVSARVFGIFDADGDGRVTIDEYGDSYLSQFTNIDKNHDGFISLPELIDVGK